MAQYIDTSGRTSGCVDENPPMEVAKAMVIKAIENGIWDEEDFPGIKDSLIESVRSFK